MKQNCWGNDTHCWGSEAICVGEVPQIQSEITPSRSGLVWSGLVWSGLGTLHFVFGAFPQHILLHFPNNLCHFPNNFASFPQQFCFISPTICFISPTICFISPTICFISPNHFLVSPTIFCQFAPPKKSQFFGQNCSIFKCGSFLAPSLHLGKPQSN